MRNSPPYRLLHIITDLGIGGAEMALYNLVSNLDRSEFASSIVALSGEGPIGEKIRRLGFPVTCLGFRPGVPDPRLILHLRREIRTWQPMLIQTWMYHANLAGSLAASLSGAIPVLWNIRHADHRNLKPLSRLIIGLNAILSYPLPRRIICCAEAARTFHARLGFDRSKLIVIPNGFNLDTFRPQPQARSTVRRELGLNDNALLIGLGARFAPEKDHSNFIRAATILAQSTSDVHFVLWGHNVDTENRLLRQWIEASGTPHRFHLLGVRLDTPRLLAALDVFSLSSVNEAFPNALGEAMACGVPCVTTDAGDAALLLGDTGIVVPSRNPQALAEAWGRLLAMAPAERTALGQAARRRIEDHFGISKMIAAYVSVYRNVLGQHPQNAT